MTFESYFPISHEVFVKFFKVGGSIFLSDTLNIHLYNKVLCSLDTYWSPKSEKQKKFFFIGLVKHAVSNFVINAWWKFTKVIVMTMRPMFLSKISTTRDAKNAKLSSKKIKHYLTLSHFARQILCNFIKKKQINFLRTKIDLSLR